jgi:hypothetical protein
MMSIKFKVECRVRRQSAARMMAGVTPESLAMCLLTHPIGGPDSVEGFRRRDADGCGRDDRASEEVANDCGVTTSSSLELAPFRLSLNL